MAYEKQSFYNQVKDAYGNVLTPGTVLKKEHLDHIEEGIFQAQEELAKKVTKPDNPVAGYYLKIKSVNSDGTMTVEAVPAPSGSLSDADVKALTYVKSIQEGKGSLATNQVWSPDLRMLAEPTEDDHAATKKYVDERTGNGSGENDSVFAGRTADFYGDSLTEDNYHYTKGYHAWVAELLGLASYNNYGKSGYRLSDIYEKLLDVMDSPDIVFIMGGVNDQTFSVPLGKRGDTTTSTTYGAIHALCSKIRDKYPTQPVIFITPHYQAKYPHTDGITSYEVSKAIREVCDEFAIPVYDNYTLSGICAQNLSIFTTDNCHWNDVGHEMVGKNLASYVLNTFRYVYVAGETGGNTHTHSYTATVTAAATCTTAGVRTYTCECGHSYTESIPATGHSYVDGVCSVCGAKEDGVDDGTLVGKTVSITLNDDANNTQKLLCALIAVDEDMVAGAEVTVAMSGTNATGMIGTTMRGGGVFTDESGAVSNGAYKADIGGMATTTQTVDDDGNVTWDITTRTLISDATTPYLKVVWLIGGTAPFSFDITQFAVSVNGNEKEVITLGTFGAGGITIS